MATSGTMKGDSGPLLSPDKELTDTGTHNTFEEGKDVVSPIPRSSIHRLNKIHSLTKAKRAWGSAISSPLNSVRFSITPKVG